MPGLPTTVPVVHIRYGRVAEDIVGGARILPPVDNPESTEPMIGGDGIVSCAICDGDLSVDDVVAMLREGEDVFLCSTCRKTLGASPEALRPARPEQR